MVWGGWIWTCLRRDRRSPAFQAEDVLSACWSRRPCSRSRCRGGRSCSYALLLLLLPQKTEAVLRTVAQMVEKWSQVVKKIGQEQQRPSLTAESFPHKLSNNPPFHLLSAPQLLLWLELTISTAAKPAARRISDPTHQTPLPPFPALSLPLSLLASKFSVEFTEIYLSQLIMPTFIVVTLAEAYR